MKVEAIAITMKEWKDIRNVADIKTDKLRGCRVKRRAFAEAIREDLTSRERVEIDFNKVIGIIYEENYNLGTKKYPDVFKEMNFASYGGKHTDKSVKKEYGGWCWKSRIWAYVVREV